MTQGASVRISTVNLEDSLYLFILPSTMHLSLEKSGNVNGALGGTEEIPAHNYPQKIISRCYSNLRRPLQVFQKGITGKHGLL